MRIVVTLTALAIGLSSLTACGGGPVFARINEVKVRHIGPSGLTETTLEQAEHQAMVKCLKQTKEIDEGQAKRDLLQTTYLLEISDNRGDRSFELYTRHNMKGNKGKYYVNKCAYDIIQEAKRVKTF